MHPEISICIATYRRPAGLRRLLDSLSKSKLPADVGVELIVVDNDATGAAAAVALADPSLFGGARYFVEPRQNIAHARNRALSVARGRWLAFVDDDEVVEPDWLRAYLEFLDAHECDAAFGPVLPRLERAGADWLDVDAFYARPRQRSGSIAQAPCTSNAIVRRAALAERRFDPSYGRSGGEDSELFGALQRAGARLLWCDEARVIEYIPPERHRLGWLARRAFRGGCTHTRQLHSARRARAGLRALIGLGVFGLGLPLAGLGGRRRAARAWLRVCAQAGHLWSALGRSYEEYRGDSSDGAVLAERPRSGRE